VNYSDNQGSKSNLCIGQIWPRIVGFATWIIGGFITIAATSKYIQHFPSHLISAVENKTIHLILVLATPDFFP